MTEAIDWIIDPGKAVGPIAFGMTPEAVEGIIGPSSERLTRGPVKRSGQREGKGATFTEFRTNPKTGRLHRTHPVVHYESDRVVMLEFLKTAKTLRFGDIRLFDGKRQAVIDQLTAKSHTVFQTFEGFLFCDLGLQMMSAENARGSVDGGEWNIAVVADGQFDHSIRSELESDLGQYVKGGEAA